MPFENSGFTNLSSNIYTPSASASVVQPYVPLNNDQCGRNNMSSSANNFLLVLHLLFFQLRFYKIAATMTEVSVLMLMCSSLVIRQ